MPPKIFVTAISLGALVGFPSIGGAQEPKPPVMAEMLQRLTENLNRYDTRVPNLFCDEHVISQMESGSHNQKTVTDSIYRLKRMPNPDHTISLIETRDIKKIDGKPATSQELAGPTLLSGWFEAGLALISLNQIPCTNYSLQKIKKDRPKAPWVVRFEIVLNRHNVDACLLQEDSTGRAFVDPETMQITHLELMTPRHVILPRQGFTSPIVGKRLLSIDYAPVELGGETFWMPSTITMRATSGSGTFHRMVWSFQGTYRNYHKLQVTSRIVPTPD